MAHGSTTRQPSGAARLILRLIVVVGLAIDAWVHFALASGFDANTADISEGTLFRIEGSLAIAAAVLVLLVRRWITDVFAFLVALSGFGVLLVYRYINIGAWGPFPSLYEPIWYTKKILVTVFEGIAALAALVLVLTPRRRG
jgi:hypothetical protein